MNTEPMDAAAAREHIEMVDRILAESSQRLCFGAEYFIVWGLYAGVATLIPQLIETAGLSPNAYFVQLVLLAGAIVFSWWRALATRGQRGRRSLVQREFFNVLWLTIGLAFAMNVAAFRIFNGFAIAAIWSFAFAIVLFYIGMHGNRRAQVAGIVTLVSIVAANFASPAITGYILAAGMVVGYGGFGLAELLAGE